MILLPTEGQFSDCKAAFALLEHLPPGSTLIADKAYDSHRLRHALRARKIRPCIPVRKGQWDDNSFDPRLYRQRNVIERFFGRLKDFRRIAMRYDRCPISFFTAITTAVIVIAFL